MRMRWRVAALAAGAAALCPGAQGGFTVTNSSVDTLVGLESGTISVKRKWLGAQTLMAAYVNTTAELAVFTREDFDAWCYKGVRASEVVKYRDKILILDRDLVNEWVFTQTCWGDSPVFIDPSTFASWCEISDAVVWIERYVPSLYYNDQPGDKYLSFTLKHQWVANCTIMETYYTDALRSVTAALAAGASVGVEMSLDVPPCAAVFKSSIAQMLFRCIFAGLFGSVSVFSLGYLTGTTSRYKSNRWVNRVCLLVNFVTGGVLALALINGAFRVSDSISMWQSNLVLPMFLGSSTACDFLVAERFHELTRNMELRNKLRFSSAQRKAWTTATLLIALVLVTADVASSLMFTTMHEGSRPLLTVTLPTFFLVAQVLVNSYLALQVVALMDGLAAIRTALVRKGVDAMNDQQREMYASQGVTIARLRNWLLLSVSTAFIWVAILLLIAFKRLHEQSCQSWLLVWGMACMTKFLNQASQVAICGSGGSKQRVSPSGHDEFDD
jgi:hypothetical protein